jgi:excisionase family DNA binding protein
MNDTTALTLWNDPDGAGGTDRGTNPGTKSGTSVPHHPPRRPPLRRAERTITMPIAAARRASDRSPVAEPLPLLLTVKQTCQLLGLSRTSLHHLMVRGELRPIRIGTAVRFSVEHLHEFIDAHAAER